MRIVRSWSAGAVVAAAIAIAAPAHAGQTQVTTFGTNPGGLQMFVHVPANLPTGRPLVVVMHGCTQTAASMASAGWDTLADQYGFAVVYPQQTSTNNPVECFNWAGNYGNTADLTRGQGENESIIEMVDSMISTYGSDTTRVYVVGFSAGAAFTTVMLATWPDRFAAGSIMEGIAYECATSVAGALTCQSPGTTKTPDAWGALVRAGDSGFSGPYPRVQVWEGSSDTTVVPANQTELIKQWTDVWGTDQTADATETIGSTTHAQYMAGSTVVVDAYTVSGMDHAVAVGTDALGTCPGSTAQYFEDHAICSTLRAAAFFDLLPGNGSGSGSSSGPDTTPPSVAFESPSDNDSVTGQVTLVIAATDNVGVASIDVAVDGGAIGSITAPPYQLVWDATAAGDGAHTLTAVARDAAGNAATATVTVASGGGTGSNAGSSAGSGATGNGAGGLPSCNAGASGGAAGCWPIAAALAGLVAFGRRRRVVARARGAR